MAQDGRVFEMEQLVSSLARIFEDVPQYMSRPGHPGRISRIPENLREVQAKAYEPYFLSIGPYNHGKPKLQSMEKTKQDILRRLLQIKPEITLKDYLKEIKNVEPTARSFYSDVDMDSKEFVRMLLLDSLCIITLFCGMPNTGEAMNHIKPISGCSVDNEGMKERMDPMDLINESLVTDDEKENTHLLIKAEELNNETSSAENNVYRPRWCWLLFAHDLFLLENQIPLFILQIIHNLAYGRSETELIVTLKEAFSKILLDYTKKDPEKVISPGEEVHHLLHLCHSFFRPTVQQENTGRHFSGSSQMFRLGNAVQLYETGVRFETRPDSSEHGLLDITFGCSGKMVMPCLHVDDNTESLLRNLIALEQMKYPSLGLNMSAYAVLLLHLITLPEDVKLLRRKGIIQHHLASDKEMMYLVNRLSVGLAFDYAEDDYSLKYVFHSLKSYSERRVPRWQTWLKHRYLSNPWTMISLFAATTLLVLTAVQTYYSVYSYYYPR